MVHPGLGRIRRNKGKAQSAHTPLSSQGDGLNIGTGHPQGRVGLLERFWQHAAGRKIIIFALELPIFLGDHGNCRLHPFFPAFPLVPHAGAKGMQFSWPGALAHAKFYPSARKQIQGRNFLRHPMRLVGGQLDDPKAQADIVGALAGRAQEGFR